MFMSVLSSKPPKYDLQSFHINLVRLIDTVNNLKPSIPELPACSYLSPPISVGDIREPVLSVTTL
jgi:hypothetical protein